MTLSKLHRACFERGRLSKYVTRPLTYWRDALLKRSCTSVVSWSAALYSDSCVVDGQRIWRLCVWWTWFGLVYAEREL